MRRPFSRIGAFLSRTLSRIRRENTNVRVFEKEMSKLSIRFNDEQIAITAVRGDNYFRVTKIPSESMPFLKDPIKAGQTRRIAVEIKESGVDAGITTMRHITHLANLTSVNLAIDDIGKRIRAGNYFIGSRKIPVGTKTETQH